MDIHGKQKQQKRTSTFFEFCKAEKGILLCTDVAARGLDIPAVVSYDFVSLYCFPFFCSHCCLGFFRCSFLID
jgi:Helicase conserved C-terminal domain